MAVSLQQYVDLLIKKIEGVAKTDTAANKSPSNESIPSPLLNRGDTCWTQSNLLPSVAVAVPDLVQAYTGTSAIQCAPDTSTVPISGVYPTWLTNLTNWIPSEFGATYFVKAYIDSPGASNPQVTGTQIFDSGSGGTGEWYFDYQAGLLNFIGQTIPAPLQPGPVPSKVVYIVGYRYIGLVGVQNLGNITVGNITSVASVNATGNITGEYFFGNGAFLTGISTGSNVNYSNANVASYLPINTSDVGAANISANGNVSANGYVSATGNITGSYVIGNGALLTGIVGYSNVLVANYLPIYDGPINVSSISYGNLTQTVVLTAPIVESLETSIQLSNVSFAVNYDWVLQSVDSSSVSIGKGFVAANSTSISVTSYGNSSVGSGLGNVTVTGTGSGNIIFTASSGTANGTFNLLITEFLS